MVQAGEGKQDQIQGAGRVGEPAGVGIDALASGSELAKA